MDIYEQYPNQDIQNVMNIVPSIEGEDSFQNIDDNTVKTIVFIEKNLIFTIHFS